MTPLLRRSGALLTLLALASAPAIASAAGAPVNQATAAQKKEAQARFKAGMKAAESGDKEQALAEYQASYGSVASPNSHLLIARTLAELGRFDEAYLAYRETIAEATAATGTEASYAQAAEAATAERASLEEKLGLLQVSVTGAGPDDTLEIGGRALPREGWAEPVPVMPGTVTVTLRRASGAPITKTITVTAGSSPVVELSTAAAAPAEAPPADAESSLDASAKSGLDKRTLAYIAGGVGVAGVATFAIFGAMNNAKHSDLEAACAGNVCPSSAQELADAGRTYQTVANVGLAVGVVGLGSGVVLYLLSRGDEREQHARSRIPNVSLGPRSVTVSGRF